MAVGLYVLTDVVLKFVTWEAALADFGGSGTVEYVGTETSDKVFAEAALEAGAIIVIDIEAARVVLGAFAGFE